MKRPAGIPQSWDGKAFRWAWEYGDQAGNTIGLVCRFDDGQDKECLPFFVPNGVGFKPGGPKEPRTLFGLDSLKDKEQRVYITEGEKKAAAMHSLGFQAVTSQGGSKSAAKSDWSPLTPFKQIVILPDNDKSGEDYAQEVTRILAAQPGQREILVCRLPGLAEKGDICDWLAARVPDWDELSPVPREPGDDLDGELLESIERNAKPVSSEWLQAKPNDVPAIVERMPLRREPTAPEPYPIEALGPILAPVAEAIAEATKAAPSLIGNSLLAASALAVQPHGDVSVDGRTVPTSVFALTVAASGDRKSTVDNIVLAPHFARQRQLVDAFAALELEYNNRLAVWKREREAILGAKKQTREWKEIELQLLGEQPQQPPQPVILAPDWTVEGIRGLLRSGLPSIGLFSDEGGRIIGGHSMLPENALKTISILSGLWDGKGGVTVRNGEGVISLFGKRVSQHLMMQPSVGPLLFANADAQGQGYLWRCLPVWPETVAGTCFYAEQDITQRSVYKFYFTRLLSILEAPLPVKQGTLELEPRELPLSPEAKQLYIEFYNSIERERGTAGRWSPVASFAARVPEHALRIAGVLTLLDNINASEVTAEDMQRGITLAAWYLREGMRILEFGLDDPDLVLAERLLEWMKSRPQSTMTKEVYQSGPSRSLRNAQDARRVLGILERHGQIKRAAGEAEAWEIAE